MSTTALGASGGNFLLGRTNTAETPTSLSSTLQQAAQSALVVVNKSGGPALDLRVGNATTPANNVAPLKVNSSKTVANLSADRIDGQDSATFQRRVSGGCAVGSSIRTIGADGTVTCEPDAAGEAEANAIREELAATDEAGPNEERDPVSYTKLKDVPEGVVRRDADTLDGRDSTAFLGAGGKASDADRLDGRDSTDFATAGHRHTTVVRTNSTFAAGKMNQAKTLSVECLPGEVATGGGGGFTQTAGQDWLHMDTVTVYGTDSRGGPVQASGPVEDHSWANGGLLGSYPMKVVDGNAVIAGDGEPAEAWGVSYTHESTVAAREVKVWVVCQS